MSENPHKRAHGITFKDKRFRTSNNDAIRVQQALPKQQSPYIPAIPLPQQSPNFGSFLQEQNILKQKLEALQLRSPEKFSRETEAITSHISFRRDGLPINKLVEDLTLRYQNQKSQKKQLEEKIRILQQEYQQKAKANEQRRIDSQNRKAGFRYDIKQLKYDRSEIENQLNEKVDRYNRVLDFYQSLSGVQIKEENGAFLVRVKWLQDEISYKIKPVDDSYDYELVSHTVPKDQIPSFLQQEINIEQEEAPKLLHLIISSLH